jgi:hypothetical protein
MVMVLEPFPFLQLWQNHSPAGDGFDGLVRKGGVFKVQGLECMVMVLEPFPYPQLWQNHSSASDGLMVGWGRGGVFSSRFRIYGNGTGTLSFSSALAKPFSS